MFSLTEIQTALQKFGMEGWLLYDFRGSNMPTRRVLGLDGPVTSRRFFYFIPAHGLPQKLVHRIEDSVLDHLPGKKTIYLRWQELEADVGKLLSGHRKVAMEYAPRNNNPYVSRVDGGTIELVRSCGVEIVSSGNLVQLFEATWDDEQQQSHFAAAIHTNSAYAVAWKFIADRVRQEGGVEETAVRDEIMRHFAQHGLTTYSPPIIGRAAHSGLPHYETGTGGDTRIRSGDLVLVDLWAKLDKPRSVYSDLTRMGFVGTTVPAQFQTVFDVVTAARDAAITCVKQAFASGQPLQGYQVDDACRAVIERAEFGKFFVHRTGHSIGQEVHGNGANIDNLETREERLLLPRTCFSIEPGIYQPEFGVRSEINVFIDAAGVVHVTGGELQRNIVPILA